MKIYLRYYIMNDYLTNLDKALFIEKHNCFEFIIKFIKFTFINFI